MSSKLRRNPLSGLKVRAVARICPGVSLRPIFAILIAIAMLFAPFAMPTGAMAMAPADEHSQMMMASDHCGDTSSDANDSNAIGKSCCIAMCAAVAVAPVSALEPQTFARIVDRPSVSQFTHGYLAELATPPPRRA